jgi:hypothetical protein
MTELILSDITVMGQGFCVIGIEQISPGSYRSVRPLPPGRSYAWPNPFSHSRGDCVLTRLTRMPTINPHTEDHNSQGLRSTGRALEEKDLVAALKQAEVSEGLEGLFECGVESPSSRNCWIAHSHGTRSICGCEVRNIRFRVFEDPGRLTLRAQLVCPSGERLEPKVVDREWVTFLQRLMGHFEGEQAGIRARAFLNGPVCRLLMRSSSRFARIGVAREMEGKCWLMLDSLFPQPKESWFEMLEGE